MSLALLSDPDIRITKSHCASFASGFCYSASNPFYSGHYETFDEALKAAKRDKQQARAAAFTLVSSQVLCPTENTGK